MKAYNHKAKKPLIYILAVFLYFCSANIKSMAKVPTKIVIGNTYGQNLVLSKDLERTTAKRKYWIIKCVCGYVLSKRADQIFSVCKKCADKSRETHGMWRTTEFEAWSSMKRRCSNSYHSPERYKNRGITICERWLHSFENFYEDMGPKPGPQYSLDRKDNDGDYEPSNCRWATPTEQANNRASSKFIEYNGEVRTIWEWHKYLNLEIKPETFSNRFKKYGIKAFEMNNDRQSVVVNKIKVSNGYEEFDSISEAAAKFKIPVSSICNNLSNRSKSAGGHVWHVVI